MPGGNAGGLLIAMDRVVKSIKGARILDGVSLDIGPGCTWISGANGSGKSTLARIVAGLSFPDSGKVRAPPGIRIGYASTERQLAPGLSCQNLLAISARQQGGGNRGADAALARFELSPNRKQRCRDLSTGEMQRVRMAVSMLCSPTLLIFDEIHIGLDDLGREIYSRCVAEVLASGGGVLCLGQSDPKLRFGISHCLALSDGALSEA